MPLPPAPTGGPPTTAHRVKVVAVLRGPHSGGAPKHGGNSFAPLGRRLGVGRVALVRCSTAARALLRRLSAAARATLGRRSVPHRARTRAGAYFGPDGAAAPGRQPCRHAGAPLRARARASTLACRCWAEAASHPIFGSPMPCLVFGAAACAVACMANGLPRRSAGSARVGPESFTSAVICGRLRL